MKGHRRREGRDTSTFILQVDANKMADLPDDRPLDAVTGQEHHFVTVPRESTVHPGPSTPHVVPEAAHTDTQHVAAQPPSQPVVQPAAPAARPQPKRVPTAVITRPGEPEVPQNQGALPDHAIKHTVHVPNTAQGDQASVVPATQAHAAPEHALPTAPNVHPEAQERELEEVGRRDPGLVAAQVEKSRGDRRALKGKEEGGTVVQGIEDDKLWALLRRFDSVSPTSGARIKCPERSEHQVSRAKRASSVPSEASIKCPVCSEHQVSPERSEKQVSRAQRDSSVSRAQRE